MQCRTQLRSTARARSRCRLQQLDRARAGGGDRLRDRGGGGGDARLRDAERAAGDGCSPTRTRTKAMPLLALRPCQSTRSHWQPFAKAEHSLERSFQECACVGMRRRDALPRAAKLV